MTQTVTVWKGCALLLSACVFLSGCVCYHTDSPVNIVKDAQGQPKVVDNPNYEASKRCEWMPATPSGGGSITCTRVDRDTVVCR